jgi:acyl dehydratase
MDLSQYIGLAGPDYEVDIERGKIREFARAMAAPVPDFVSGRSPVIPATFLVCAPYTWGYTLERPRGTVFAKIDHDFTVSLHAEESFVFVGPSLRAGDRLTARPSLEKTWTKTGVQGGGMTFLTMLTEYRTEDGKLRAEQRSTSVTTQHAPGESEGWAAELPPYEPAYDMLERSSPFSGIERQAMSELRLDKGPGPVSAGPLLMQDIVRFQGVVGEDDPLHHDVAWARQNGYPGPFALGTHQASLMAAYAAYWLAPEAVRGFKVRFRNICWPGDRLVYDGRISGLDLGAGTAKVHLTCRVENGRLVSEAWMEFDFTANQGTHP